MGLLGKPAEPPSPTQGEHKSDTCGSGRAAVDILTALLPSRRSSAGQGNVLVPPGGKLGALLSKSGLPLGFLPPKPPRAEQFHVADVLHLGSKSLHLRVEPFS